MGEAIDGLIGALSHVQLDSKEEEEKTTVSDEHQVVLSCCWLNLKVGYWFSCLGGHHIQAVKVIRVSITLDLL